MELHEYQHRIIEFCKTHNNAVLSVAMGLGKTASVLHYINEVKPESVLIVAPKRVAETTWKQEAEKWVLTDVADKMVIVKGTKAKRVQALEDMTKPYKIVSRDNLKDLGKRSFSLLVIDELTTFKNIKSKRFEMVKQIDARQKIGLTGTFLANGAIDIFGQCAAVGIELNGGNFYVWRALNFRDVLQGSGLQFQKWQLTKPLDEMLAPIADNIFTLSAADYLNIPKVTEATHAIELSKDEMNAYKDLDAFLGFEINGTTMTFEEGAKFAKLQTLCNGFVYDDEGVAVRGAESSKLEAVADFCASAIEEGEHVLLFYAYREEAQWLYEKLKARKLSVDSAKADGFFERWNRGETDVLMAHPASAGHGLNLQHGGRVIVWSSLTYNYEYFAQANARLARQGQTKPVSINYFIAKGTIEQAQCKALQKKDKEQNEFIRLTKQ